MGNSKDDWGGDERWAIDYKVGKSEREKHRFACVRNLSDQNMIARRQQAIIAALHELKRDSTRIQEANFLHWT